MTAHDIQEEWMDAALEHARAALTTGDVPVGAVLIDAEGRVIASGHNEREARHDPTAHAELLAIQRAAQTLGDWRLLETTLVVTLEPCIMCAGAIVAARIPRLIFGAWDDKAGGCGSVYDIVRDRRLNHTVEVIPGVKQEECSQLLSSFFRQSASRLPRARKP